MSERKQQYFQGSHQPFIEGLESFEVAQQVIHSLRAKRRNQKNYQQLFDDTTENLHQQQPIINHQELNSIIQKQKVSYEEYSRNKIKVEQIFDASLSMASPSPSLASVNFNPLPMPPAPSLQDLSLKPTSGDFDEEDSDEEIESQPRKQKQTQQRQQQQQMKLPPSKHNNNNNKEDAFQQKGHSKEYAEGEDAYLYDEEEDDEDLLSRDFVPPLKATGGGGGGEGYSLNKSNITNRFTSKNDVAANAIKKGIIIKPGQAIRVNSKPAKKT